MLKIIAGIIFLLIGFRIIEDTADVAWLGIGLALLAIGLVIDWMPGAVGNWRRD